VLVHNDLNIFLRFHFTPSRREKIIAISLSVSISYLPVCSLAYLKNRTSKLHEILFTTYQHCDHGSVLL